MTSNRTSMKLQKGKVRSSAGASPARSEENTNMPDLSIIRKSIITSVTGFAQACNVFQTGTTELKQLLTLECDIIYECRVCRNLFRSLANFISHKRVYCCEKFNTSLHPHFSNNSYAKDDIDVIMKSEDEYRDYLRNKATIISKNKVESDSMKNKRKDLTSVIEKLLHKTGIGENSDSENASNLVKMLPIPETSTAVYQSVISSNRLSHDSIRDQVAELDRMISSNEAVLGLDGKLLTCHSSTKPETFYNNVTNNSNGRSDNKNTDDELFCKICKISFSTLKTKKFHIKHKHAINRLVYPCTDCTDTFSNSWSVYRHLYKVHRKTSATIRKSRDNICKRAYIETQVDTSEKVKAVAEVAEPLSEQQRMDQENQAWIDNLEGDGDIPRCGGCGKRFERRAALCSHRQTCQLRKSAQNKINSNSQKRFANKMTSNLKDIEDYPEPVVKLAKIDKLAEKLTGEKPIERKIEIKIRKDYNKSSPASVRTNSPSINEEDTSLTENADQDDLTNSDGKLGENDYDVISNNDMCNEYNQDDSNFTVTVKDYDDAIVDFDKNDSDNSNDDMTYVDEGELTNCDEMQRISQADGSPNKACGQIDDSSLSKDDFSFTMNNYELLVGNNDSIGISEEKRKSTEDCVEKDGQISGRYQCAYCASTFSVKHKLEKHISRHLIWIKFECKLCGVKSCNLSQYQKHMKMQHQMLQPTRLMKMASKMNPGNVQAVCDSDIFADAMDNDFLDEGSDHFEYGTSEVMNLKRSKPKNTYRPIKRKKHLIKKAQKVNRKKSALLSDAFELTDKDSSAITKFEPSLEEKIQLVSSVDWDIFESKIDLDSLEADKSNKTKIKKSNQHIASSESCTVKRPVRNRIKNFDKDFEYDCSYLPKAKSEHKESSLTVFTQKPHLKRKQFLQNELIAEDIKSSQETDQSVSKSELSPQPKIHRGALQLMSVKVATQGKAQMKTKQSTTTRRNNLPFVRPSYRPNPPTEREPAKSTPPLPSPPGTEKATAPAKAIQMKVLLQPCLHMKPYEKLYSESTRLKVGSPRKSLPPNPKQYPAAVPKTERRSNQTSIRKKKMPLQKLPMTKIDQQAINSTEITMLTKSQCKYVDKESDKSDTSLSILPTKNSSSFVNISLQQLKNLQRDSNNQLMISSKSSATKNISVLKNLEENNEIKICKVSQYERKGEEDTLRMNKDIIQKSMAKAFRKSLSKKCKKPNLTNTDIIPFRTKNIDIAPIVSRPIESANIFDDDLSSTSITINRIENLTDLSLISSNSPCESVNISLESNLTL